MELVACRIDKAYNKKETRKDGQTQANIYKVIEML